MSEQSDLKKQFLLDELFSLCWKEAISKKGTNEEDKKLNIKVHLRLGGDKNNVAEGYRRYWLDEISQINDIMRH